MLNKKNRISIIILIILFIVVSLIAVKVIWFSNINKNDKTVIDLTQRDLDIVFGYDSALVAVFMYANYGCPYCRKFFTDIYPAIKKEYIDSGKVKIIMRLTFKTVNQDLLTAMKAAVCVNKFGNYEYLHQLVLSQSNIVYTKEFHDIINEFIDKDLQVAECILGGAADEYLKKNIEEFDSLQLKGTPAFIIGNKIFYGLQEKSIFVEILNFYLKQFNN